MKKLPWRSILSGVSLAVVAIFLTGCFDTRDEFTLNPDGSGKVEHESTFDDVNLFGAEDHSEQKLKDAVAKFIDSAKGVEAWRDISYKWTDDGRMYFKGTAYFKNLNLLEFSNQGWLKFDWKTNAAGGWLTLSTNKSRTSTPGLVAKKDERDLAKMTPEERLKSLKQDRAKFRQMKPMLAGIFGNMKHAVSFHLPGKSAGHSGFTAAGDRLKLEFSGEKLIAALDELISDDAWLARNIDKLGPDQSPAMDEKVSLAVFGSKGPMRATVTDAQRALFDYAAELAEAKKTLPQQLRLVAAGPLPQTAPAQTAELKSLKVIGVRYVDENGRRRDLPSYDHDPGYTLSLFGELPGSVISITDNSGLDSAIADDGSDLLPDLDSARRFQRLRLTKDKTGVAFDAPLRPPGPAVRGLKLLTGHLEYTAAANLKEVDLGFPELKAGATGTEFGARIESISTAWGPKQLAVKLKISKHALKKLYLVDAIQKTELEPRGINGGVNDNWTFMYETKSALTANARLVAETYDQVRTVRVPFKLENISLLGAPLAAQK